MYNNKSYGFNSIMVQLERKRDKGPVIQGLFQFHYGSIRTSKSLRAWSDGNLFQFHKGSIRTRTRNEVQQLVLVSIP